MDVSEKERSETPESVESPSVRSSKDESTIPHTATREIFLKYSKKEEEEEEGSDRYLHFFFFELLHLVTVIENEKAITLMKIAILWKKAFSDQKRKNLAQFHPWKKKRLPLQARTPKTLFCINTKPFST